MMLRSSSTPVLGSLLPSSFSESPSQSELHNSSQKHTPSSIYGRISCTNGRKSMFQYSPSVSENMSATSSGGLIRRVQSEGNLGELVDACSYHNVDEFTLSKKSAARTRRNSCCTLEAIPSFSLNHRGSSYDDSDDDEEEEEEECEEEGYGEDMRLREIFDSLRNENMGTIASERSNNNDHGSLVFEGEGKMYLATGLGVSGVDFGGGGNGGNGGGSGGGNYRPVSFEKDGGDSQGISMEEHYKRMLEGDPGNTLFLRNYAQFLYQKKRDLEGAEEYYSRAILADPHDGEILSQYAKIVWELHRDKERATSYFERALQALSGDSHIHAAYANFLWDTEDDDEEENEKNAVENSRVGQTLLHHGFMASATA